jgi:threonine dehydrogenase-like Zn-dependent dehydrogenase
METVLALLERVEPGDLITHRLPFHRAPEAYPLLEAGTEEAVQVVFTYGRIREGQDV